MAGVSRDRHDAALADIEGDRRDMRRGVGFSATIASVVISNPAIEAASCSAVRTTLVGSMMPLFSIVRFDALSIVFPHHASDERLVDSAS